MKSLSDSLKVYALVALFIGAVSFSGCSNKSDSEQETEATPETTSESQVTTDSSDSSSGRDVSNVPPEMGLVVQNYGMAKFSELKRLNELGFALFSIFSDGTVSSAASANLSDYQIDWSSAKISSYGPTQISLLTPSIKIVSASEVVESQQVMVEMGVEMKVVIETPESIPVAISIETLVSDSSRTICVLGFTSR